MSGLHPRTPSHASLPALCAPRPSPPRRTHSHHPAAPLLPGTPAARSSGTTAPHPSISWWRSARLTLPSRRKPHLRALRKNPGSPGPAAPTGGSAVACAPSPPPDAARRVARRTASRVARGYILWTCNRPLSRPRPRLRHLTIRGPMEQQTASLWSRVTVQGYMRAPNHSSEVPRDYQTIMEQGGASPDLQDGTSARVDSQKHSRVISVRTGILNGRLFLYSLQNSFRICCSSKLIF